MESVMQCYFMAIAPNPSEFKEMLECVPFPSRLIQLLFFIFIVRFCSNSWTWEGHILGLFNFDLLYFLIENDFDYTVFKIDMVQVSGITRMLGF